MFNLLFFSPSSLLSLSLSIYCAVLERVQVIWPPNISTATTTFATFPLLPLLNYCGILKLILHLNGQTWAIKNTFLRPSKGSPCTLPFENRHSCPPDHTYIALLFIFRLGLCSCAAAPLDIQVFLFGIRVGFVTFLDVVLQAQIVIEAFVTLLTLIWPLSCV